jgi:hypothetical protein
MATDSVRVQFSASIGALIKGVDDAKNAIDSVRQSTDRVSDGAKSLLEAFGLAFSVEKISEFVNQMADLGEQTERMASTLGISTEDVGKLGAIAKGTGTSTESLARSMEMFQTNMQKAQAGTGPAAAALQALGFTAKDFIGLPIPQQIDKLADAFAKFADGGNKVAVARALFGRIGAELIPTLDEGASGFDKFTAMAQRAGTVLDSETTRAFANSRQVFNELGMAIEGVGIRAFKVLEPVIDAATKQITAFVESLDSHKIETGLKTVGTVAVEVLEDVSLFFVEATREFDTLAAKMGAVDIKRAALNILDPNLGNLILGPDKQLDSQLAQIEEDARRRTEEVKKLAEQWHAAILAFTVDSTLGGKGPSKPQLPAMAVPDKDALSAQMAQYQNQIKLADEAYKQTQEQLASEVKLHEITYDQETAQLLAALDKRHAAEDTATIREMELYKEGTAGYVKALDERKLKDAEYYAARQKLVDAAKQKDVQEWQSALQPVVAVFDSQLQGLLSGTETWAQAMKKITADLVMDIIKKLEEIAVANAALGLTNLFGGGLGSLLGLGGGGGGGGKGGIPSFDVGSWSVPGDTLALVHQNEMVVPAQGGTADAVRSMLTGGFGGNGSNVSIAINNPSVGTQAQLNSIVEQFSRILQSHQLRTPSSSWA